MKGLLYKDFRVLVREMKFMLLLVILFCLIPQRGDFFFGGFFFIYGGLMIPFSLMAYDERAKWDTLAAMLPYAPRDLVLSRYCMGWLIAACAGVVYLIGRFFLPSGQPFAPADATALLMMVGLFLLLQAVFLPILFRNGVEKARMMGILLLVVIAILVGGLTALFSELLPTLASLAAFLPLIGLALCLASIPLSIKLYCHRR
ncbi:MAG: ABC-2 transporter permease [Evtepia sp.]|uniref:ABC-2 transporter permease n=1 Tax=Evtepia sp. TaxID=2773933 RepID=UPI002A754520|nr:ABC-2 transporter permease [Evtepia sp.]MDY3014694.1 ABC-2 transporter permease [Evtepia sp.]